MVRPWFLWFAAGEVGGAVAEAKSGVSNVSAQKLEGSI